MSGKYMFKIILAGSGGCGKTTLLNKFTTGSFTSNTKMTIGVDFATHNLSIPDTEYKGLLGRSTVAYAEYEFATKANRLPSSPLSRNLRAGLARGDGPDVFDLVAGNRVWCGLFSDFSDCQANLGRGWTIEIRRLEIG